MELEFDVTPKQKEMLESPARTQWIGAGTKTGKTVAAAIWIALGILAGEPTAWCGPWSARTRTGYLKVKSILQYHIAEGLVKANDSSMRIVDNETGGTFEPFTGDNPQGIYGEGIKRFVIDEASRQTVDSFHAATTTVSAAKGSIKCLFNLDLGGQNWAIQELLRVQGLSQQERIDNEEDFLLFKTGDGGLVDDAEIARAKRTMPKALFDALFNAIIPETDLTLFHNLQKLFGAGGPVPKEPKPGNVYIMGLDVARKQDWTAATIMDLSLRRIVHTERMHRIDWPLQYKSLKATYDFWNVSKTLVDCTGLGDPVESALRELGMNIEGFQFTEKSKEQLIEGAVIDCNQETFDVCQDEQFDVLRSELDNFQVMLDGKRVRYGVIRGTDDAAFSWMLTLALARQQGTGKADFTPAYDKDESKDYGAF